MNIRQDLKTFLAYTEQFMPHLSIDCVIFGFHHQQLKVLLLKLQSLDIWALPGGYIYKQEGVEQAALRVLAERTGLKDIYLEQFHVFGQAERSTKDLMLQILQTHQIEVSPDAWFLQRFVSIGYYALVDVSKVNPQPNYFAETCDWISIEQLPVLAFDHQAIIQKALASLQNSLDDKLLIYNFLPAEFTMRDLHSLYETILGKKIRKSNFQRKMLGLDILERLEKKYTGAANKAPYLYRFKT